MGDYKLEGLTGPDKGVMVGMTSSKNEFVSYFLIQPTNKHSYNGNITSSAHNTALVVGEDAPWIKNYWESNSVLKMALEGFQPPTEEWVREATNHLENELTDRFVEEILSENPNIKQKEMSQKLKSKYGCLEKKIGSATIKNIGSIYKVTPKYSALSNHLQTNVTRVELMQGEAVIDYLNNSEKPFSVPVLSDGVATINSELYQFLEKQALPGQYCFVVTKMRDRTEREIVVAQASGFKE